LNSFSLLAVSAAGNGVVFYVLGAALSYLESVCLSAQSAEDPSQAAPYVRLAGAGIRRLMALDLRSALMVPYARLFTN